MRRYLAIVIMLSIVILSSGCISGGEEDIDWTITVYGDIPSSFVIEYAELADMPQTSMEKQLVSGKEMYSGVPLTHIVEMADLTDLIDTVNCHASDGYILTFTLNDFNNGILATELEGERLDEDRGPVMLGFNVGCACNWMKQVVGLEFFNRSDSLGLIGDVANPIYVTIDDIRHFTGKEDGFTLSELFKKVAYYPQAQSFNVFYADGERNYPISTIEGATLNYANGSFSVSIGGENLSDVESLDCVWDPDL